MFFQKNDFFGVGGGMKIFCDFFGGWGGVTIKLAYFWSDFLVLIVFQGLRMAIFVMFVGYTKIANICLTCLF